MEVKWVFNVFFWLALDGKNIPLALALSEVVELATPPPPNTIKIANEGRFRLNVDSPYGERAQSTVLTRDPPRRPARPRRDFIFNLSMRESKASPVVVCLHQAPLSLQYLTSPRVTLLKQYGALDRPNSMRNEQNT